MDALAADFCPPKKTIVDTIAAAPSRLARFCFSFSFSSEDDDSDEDATIEKEDFSRVLLFDDDDALLLMKILLEPPPPPRGFCSRLLEDDDDRIIIHLAFFFFEQESKEEPTTVGVKAALPLLLIIEAIVVFAPLSCDGIYSPQETTTLETTLLPKPKRSFFFVPPFQVFSLTRFIHIRNPKKVHQRKP